MRHLKQLNVVLLLREAIGPSRNIQRRTRCVWVGAIALLVIHPNMLLRVVGRV